MNMVIAVELDNVRYDSQCPFHHLSADLTTSSISADLTTAPEFLFGRHNMGKTASGEISQT